MPLPSNYKYGPTNQVDALLIETTPDLYEFARDCRDNWDCDGDGHRYGTGCRKCAARDVLAILESQTKATGQPQESHP